MARPRLKVDAAQVEKLAAIFCSTEEISSVLGGVSKRTLERRFGAVMQKGRERGKMSIRRKQYELAMNGNVTMLIWLGKQHLGQVERQQIDLTRVDNEAFAQEARRRLELNEIARNRTDTQEVLVVK